MPADDIVTVVREPAPGEQLFVHVTVSKSEPHAATRMELVDASGATVASAYWGATLYAWAVEPSRGLPEPLYAGKTVIP